MSTNATATRSAAYNTIIASSDAVTPITSESYTTDDYIQLRKGLISASKSVPTTLCGGSTGHAFIILDAASFDLLVGTATTRTFVVSPSTIPTYNPSDSATQVAIKEAAWHSTIELFHTQEGCKEGLKKLIIKNVPSNAIMELEDEEFGFESVTPLQLMEHLESNCEVVDCLDVKELITQRDTPIDLDGDETLKTFFKNTKKTLKKLVKNGITTSESEMMVNITLQIEEDDDFDETVVEWKAKTATDKTWANFQTHFIEADRIRRAKNKLKKKTTKSAGFHSSANAAIAAEVEANKTLINDNFAQLAVATDATIDEKINAAIETLKSNDRFSKPAASSPAIKPTDSNVAMLKILEDMSKRLTSMEAENKRLRNNPRRGGKADDGKPKCKHCKGRMHPRGEDSCWELEANAATRPNNWVSRK
jgi:hypothetical protein